MRPVAEIGSTSVQPTAIRHVQHAFAAVGLGELRSLVEPLNARALQGTDCMRVVDKAFAYITSRGRLLVFEPVAFPEAGVQVPAGTILAGEAPAVAVVREATEETGLHEFSAVEFIGSSDVDARPHGKDELHRRHFFHLPLAGSAPVRWRHFERDPSDGVETPIEFELFWVSLEEAAACLSHGHGSFIERLRSMLLERSS